MQSVIVIGASGFLGSSVSDELRSLGYDVFAVKNNSNVTGINQDRIILGGIRSLTSSVIKKINPVAIYHCGRPTYSRFRKCGRIIAGYQAARLNTKLLSELRKSDIHAPLVFASGSLAYGNSSSPHSESSPINPISYSRQYIRGEKPLLNANESFPVLILRFPWILGNGSWFSWFYLKNINEHKSVPLFGDGHNQMCFISRIIAAKLMVEYGLRNPGQGIYNVFSGEVSTQLEFANLLAKHSGSKVVNYKHLYKNGVEDAVMEAFCSNILLKTNYPDILNKTSFDSLEKELRKVLVK